MDGNPSVRVPVEPDERVLRAWPVEPALPDGSADRGGWLVLTTHRVLFYRKPGLFGSGRGPAPALFVRRLEEIGTLTSGRYWMKIGYGDRTEIPGVTIDGQGFRLNRETPSQSVLAAIETARQSRRSALGPRSP